MLISFEAGALTWHWEAGSVGLPNLAFLTPGHKLSRSSSKSARKSAEERNAGKDKVLKAAEFLILVLVTSSVLVVRPGAPNSVLLRFSVDLRELRHPILSPSHRVL